MIRELGQVNMGVPYMKDSKGHCNALVPDSSAQPRGISRWGLKDGPGMGSDLLPTHVWAKPQEARGDVGRKSCQGSFASVRGTNPLSKAYLTARISKRAR